MSDFGSRYELRDYSDDDGEDFEVVEVFDGIEEPVGRHFSRSEAEAQLVDLRFVEDVDRDLDR